MTLALNATISNPAASPAVEVPPPSNTGGNYSSPPSNSSFSSVSSLVLPSNSEPCYVHIDTFSLSGKLETIPDGPTEFTDEHKINKFSSYLIENFGLYLVGDDLGKRNFYSHTFGLAYTDGRPSKNLGYVSWGGEHQKDSYLLYLTGEGCEYLNSVSLMPSVEQMIAKFEMKITRADIAYDDMEGFESVDKAVQYYKEGGFTFTRQPQCSNHGDWVSGNDTKGRTFYVGSRDSGKFFRVYEKGKQLGDPDSPWVRWELQLGSKDRVIPLDIFTNPSSYLAGTYPVLKNFIPATTISIIATIKKKAKKSVEQSIEIVKNQFGRYINIFSEMMTAEEVVKTLSRDGIPQRLIVTIPKLSITDPSIKDPPIDFSVYKNDGLLFDKTDRRLEPFHLANGVLIT